MSTSRFFQGLWAVNCVLLFGVLLLIIGGTIPSDLDDLCTYLGLLLVMIPYFLIALRVERRSIAERNPELDTPRLPVTVRIMNDVTWGLLAVPVVVGAVHALVKLGGP